MSWARSSVPTRHDAVLADHDAWPGGGGLESKHMDSFTPMPTSTRRWTAAVRVSSSASANSVRVMSPSAVKVAVAPKLAAMTNTVWRCSRSSSRVAPVLNDSTSAPEK